MKALANTLSHPVWLLGATVTVLALWASTGPVESERPARSKKPHPAACNGCRLAAMETGAEPVAVD